jgi:uncharacterized protein YcaQ
MRVAAEAARRFLVSRHFLAPARSLTGGPDAVLRVLGRFGSIQFDPIAVAGRNHDLVLHARVADYEPAWCDELYERREIVEATNKALSLVPAAEFPWFRHVMGRKGPEFHGEALAGNAAVAEHVLERIRAEGPLDDSAVRVLNVWWKDGFVPRRAEGFVDAMREALRAYLRFAGVSRVDWAPHLATEERLFLTRRRA